MSPAPASRLAALAAGIAFALPTTLGDQAAQAAVYTVYTTGRATPQPSKSPPPTTPEARAALQLRPLVATGAPVVVSGPVSPHGEFFRVGVRHGVTGRLTSPVSGRMWIFSDKALPAGQPVFGLPMSGSAGAGIVWCAPRLASPGGGTPPRWRAICLPQSDGAFAWIEAAPALMTLNITWPGFGVHVASPPTVEPGPVDLPPMVLSYAFGGWNKDRWLLLDVRIDWGEGPQLLHTVRMPPASDGSVALKVMHGALIVRPDGPSSPGAAVEQVSAPEADAPVDY